MSQQRTAVPAGRCTVVEAEVTVPYGRVTPGTLSPGAAGLAALLLALAARPQISCWRQEAPGWWEAMPSACSTSHRIHTLTAM